MNSENDKYIKSLLLRIEELKAENAILKKAFKTARRVKPSKKEVREEIKKSKWWNQLKKG